MSLIWSANRQLDWLSILKQFIKEAKVSEHCKFVWFFHLCWFDETIDGEVFLS